MDTEAEAEAVAEAGGRLRVLPHLHFRQTIISFNISYFYNIAAEYCMYTEEDSISLTEGVA